MRLTYFSLRRRCGRFFVAGRFSKAAPAEGGGQTNVAVAANFTEPAKEIAALFKAEDGERGGAELRRHGSVLTQIPATPRTCPVDR